MDQNLAIIIPAYKGAYLKRTLDSLVQQTNKNFSVYIGDDCSPENLPDIINQYISLLNITYKKFSDNRGKSDLISQWERCLDMIQNEEYFILFSDDDIMEDVYKRQVITCLSLHLTSYFQTNNSS